MLVEVLKGVRSANFDGLQHGMDTDWGTVSSGVRFSMMPVQCWAIADTQVIGRLERCVPTKCGDHVAPGAEAARRQHETAMRSPAPPNDRRVSGRIQIPRRYAPRR
jgi:hypothetical protein